MIPAWLSLIAASSQRSGGSGGCGIPGFGNLSYSLGPHNGFYCSNTLISSDAGSTGNPQPIPSGTVSVGGMLYEQDVCHIQMQDGITCTTPSCSLQSLVDVCAVVNYGQVTSWGETQNGNFNLGTLWKILTGSSFGVNKFSSTACSIQVTIPAITETIFPGNTVVLGYAVPTQTMLEVRQSVSGTTTCIGTRTSIVTLMPINFGGVNQYGMLYDSCANTWQGTGCTNGKPTSACTATIIGPGN